MCCTVVPKWENEVHQMELEKGGEEEMGGESREKKEKGLNQEGID